MLNESIAASPTAENDESVHTQRLRRQIKRKQQRTHQQSVLRNDESSRHGDDTHNRTFNVEHNVKFIMPQQQLFGNADLYSEADRLDCMRIRESVGERRKIKITEGFVPLTQLAAEIENQCEITNTELIDFCNDLEQQYKCVKQIVVIPKEHSLEIPEERSVSIVETILTDFCNSPGYLAEEQLIDDAGYCEPCFRFRNKHLRTYLKSRRLKDHLKHRQIYDDDDHEIETISDSSSVLSIQEDSTVDLARVKIEDFNLNASQRLQENLLNLSAFFATKQENFSNKVKIKLESFEELNLPEADDNDHYVEEYVFEIENRSEAFVENLSSLSDFLWFEPVESPCTCGVKPKNSHGIWEGKRHEELEEFHAIVDNSKNGDSSVRENNSAHNQTLETWQDDCDFFVNYKTQEASPRNSSMYASRNQITVSNAAMQIANKLVKDVCESPRDIKIKKCLGGSQSQDDWYDDCDFFANIDMREILHKVKENSSTGADEIATLPFLGFQTAGKKSINVSAEAQRRAAQILEEFPPVLDSNSEIDKAQNSAAQQNEDVPAFAGFQTARMKSISVSAEAQRRAAQILEELQPILDSDAVMLDIDKTQSSAAKENVVGFQTAGLNSIKVSTEGQTCAAKILDEFPTISVSDAEMLMDKVQSYATEKNVVARPFVGFQTAAKKSIKVSAEAQIRAAQILEELPPISGSDAEMLDINKGHNTAAEGKEAVAPFVGFQTAGKKNIAISAEAQRRAAQILEDLAPINEDTSHHAPAKHVHEISKSVSTTEITSTRCLTELNDKPCTSKSVRHNANDIENLDLENMQFSEWQLADLCHYEADPKPENEKIDITKAEEPDKLKNEPSDEVLETKPNPMVSYPMTRSKRKLDLESSCNSNSNETPIRSVACGKLQYSLSELAVRSPLTTDVTTSIISRKNLLSLSKRRKLNKNNSNLQNTNDMETPIKNNESACTRLATPQQFPNENYYTAELTTSTPRILRKPTTMNGNELEQDFEQIKWESHPNDCSTTSDTKLSPKPSPKERMERLRMYGDPPAVSPIYMLNKNSFRAPGLRRQRSLSDNKTK